MKFSDIQQILTNRFGDTPTYEAKKLLELAFPNAQSDRSTYILGIQPSRIETSTPIPSMSSGAALVALSTSIPQQSLDVIDSLRAETTRLQSRVSELEAEVQLLRQSSVQLAVVEQQADYLSTHSYIAHGPDSLEHLDSFSVSSLLHEIKCKAPDLFRLFESLSNSHRNIQTEAWL